MYEPQASEFHVISLNNSGYSALQTISEGNNAFTLDLYKSLAVQPGNLFFSPLSIQVALALVFLGAKGNTAKEIAAGLHLPDERKLIENGFGALMTKLNEYDEVTLHIANRIFLKYGCGIKEDFKAAALRFLSGAQELDFSRSEEARSHINKWVEDQTRQKIRNLVQPGVLNSDTIAVIGNAIYFKGDWATKFDKRSTALMPFRSASTTDVQMMFVKAKFRYTELQVPHSQILLLPYKGNRFSMMVVLPTEVDGLFDVEKQLADANLFDIADQTFKQMVHVYLPKFKLEYEKELEESLQTLEMRSMFDVNKANFSGISDKEHLVVNQVLHKAFIEVSEEGTEAAAATAVTIVTYSAWNAPTVFKADHPFTFFILDEEARTVLFAGRYASPKSVHCRVGNDVPIRRCCSENCPSRVWSHTPHDELVVGV
ncbi:serpin B6-like [Schistocerca serialis cubense]|uniref:serpin B6-like n=1 Tax=Schistocerca serialis cubense TaxID=2023355 RepID=UPI00214E5974|nr:serpin B6-like [Schistocerca serialis cubense]